MTIDQAKDAVKFLLAGFPREVSFMSQEAVGYMLAFYASGLQDLGYEDVRRAMVRLSRISEKLPTVAAIRAAVVTTRSSKRRTGSEAWGDLRSMRQFRELDAKKEIDPLVLEICTSFDWIEYRTLWRSGGDVEQWHVVTGENESADRARFIDAYDQMIVNRWREAQAAKGAPAIAGGAVKSLPRGDRDGGEPRSMAELVAAVAPSDGVDSGE